MTNEEYLSIRKAEWDRLEAYYDFSTVEGIESIPVPAFEVNGESATGRVEYYLKTQLYANYWNADQFDLAIACLKKANQLMFASDMIWKRNDFMELVKCLHIVGRHEEAIKQEIKINAFFQTPCPKPIRKKSINSAINSADYLNTDFIELQATMICCPNCGRLKDRVFAFRGFHPFSLKLPKGIFDGTKGCCLTARAYVFGLDKESDKETKRNNRIIGDTRSDLSKKMYKEWKADVESWDPYTNLYTNHSEFYWLQHNLPDICPKSISGYTRMKKTNSANYQKLKAKAEEAGYLLK